MPNEFVSLRESSWGIVSGGGGGGFVREGGRVATAVSHTHTHTETVGDKEGEKEKSE